MSESKGILVDTTSKKKITHLISGPEMDRRVPAVT